MPIKYYGIAELSRELKWTTEKTHVYYKRGKFIKPSAMVGNRPLWTENQLKKIFNFGKKGANHC